MGGTAMLVSEIFLSIQGESTYAGLPCVFVRLAGCNLSCTWCDTSYANTGRGDREVAPGGIMKEVSGYKCGLVEITGGEPMLQADTPALAKSLLDEGYDVLIETNGSVALSTLDDRVVKVMDVKCPTSGQAGTFLVENLEYVTAKDEIKFVIGARNDYDFARKFIDDFIKDRTVKLLFAPVKPSLDPRDLADWILKDRLKVRLQLQMHSYIWEGERGR
jgi:7-carboxy-7-deazaguanine synthase